MTTSWLFLRPRDTIAVRDGRPFDAGAGATAKTMFPWPSTVAGAVGALYGREVGSIRGPILAQRLDQGRGIEFRPVFPAPADLYGRLGATTAHRLRVEPLAAGIATDLDGVASLAKAADGQEPVDGWLRAAAMQRYLADPPLGQAFNLNRDRYVPGGQVPASVVSDEPHVGLTLTAQRTAQQGLLYTAHHLRLWDDLGLLVAVDDDHGLGGCPAHVAVGGEGRLADVERAQRVALPDAPRQFPGGRVLLYLATPGIWADGWRPTLPRGAVVVTAALKEPIPVPTASPRLRNRSGGFLGTSRLHWAVPAGSVYYVRFADPDAARDWVHGTPHENPGIHGRPLPAAEARLGTAGFGVVLAGTWTEHEETDD